MKKLFIVSLLILPLEFLLAQNFWQQSNGPYGGNITQFEFDSTHGHYYLLRNEHIYRSTNQGRTWSHFPDEGVHVQDIVVSDSGKVYASDLTNGLMVLNTWGSFNFWEFRNNGIQGFSWGSTLGVTSKGTLLMSVGSEKTYRSTDEGLSWNIVDSGKVFGKFVSSPDGVVYTVGSYNYRGTIFKSTDDGMTWDTVSSFVGLIDRLKFFNNQMFALVNDMSLYRSTDAGKTWTIQGHGIRDFTTSPEGELFSILGSDSVYRSSDLGEHWMSVGAVGIRTDYYYAKILEFSPDGHLLVGVDGTGVYRSTNKGKDWEHNGLNVFTPNSMSVNAAGDIFCGTDESVIYYSHDQGNSWYLSEVSPRTKVLAINKSGDIFAGTHYGIFRSMDNGITWDKIDNGMPEISIWSLTISHDDNAIFAGSIGGKIFKSADNGASWKEIAVADSLEDIFSIVITPSGKILAGTNLSGLYQSTDNGETWSYIKHNITNNGEFFSFIVTQDHSVLLATYDGIYRSTDDGETWSGQRLPGRWVSCFTANSNGHVFAGTMGNGVYRSTDEGNSWSPIISGLESMYIYSLASDFNGYVYAGTEGLGIFRSVSVTTSADENENTIPNLFSLSQNYPNPFNPSTTFKYEIAKAGFATLRVYDILGREIATLINEVKQPGSYSVQWNSASKPSGVYFYRLVAGSYSKTRKMVLLK